jgi:hypothetical protein
MSESALDVVAHKHATLRQELTESGELLGGARAGPAGRDDCAAARAVEVVIQQAPLATDPRNDVSPIDKPASALRGSVASDGIGPVGGV